MNDTPLCLLESPDKAATAALPGLFTYRPPPWRVGYEGSSALTIFDANGLEVMQCMWTMEAGQTARPVVDWIIAWTNAIADAQRKPTPPPTRTEAK